ncbi:hypothetical protein [Quadrisphaera granulorum]|uniref:hypothetical protein n=1 Tax=Quadrisphaera granulorum TaxID=317664 RepID=UPI000D6BE588|nr:hypothetical protein [Quadrisphaera granulorum]
MQGATPLAWAAGDEDDDEGLERSTGPWRCAHAAGGGNAVVARTSLIVAEEDGPEEGGPAR